MMSVGSLVEQNSNDLQWPSGLFSVCDFTQKHLSHVSHVTHVSHVSHVYVTSEAFKNRELNLN